MTPQGRATRLLAALLLLWVPGCLSLSCSSPVTGTVGGSLSVQCRYEKKYTDHNKYWCKYSYLPPLRVKIVETTKSEREVRSGRVSIRDHPANRTFTVTLESLRESDEGTYWCGIDRPWTEKIIDLTFPVEVSVSPATSKPTTTTTTSTSTTTATTSTVTAQIPTVSTARTVNATQSRNSQDGSQPSPDQDHGSPSHPAPPLPPSRLPVLLILLALLLLLLAGASLLAWRMVRRQRRVKAGGNPEPLQNPCQAAPQREPCYANLELQTLLQGEPVRPRQEEVEYSTVQAPREDLHYSMVVFTTQRQEPEDQSPSQRPPRQEPEYSAIRKTRQEPEYSAIRETRPEPEYSAIRETRQEPEYSAIRETRPEPEYSAIRETRPEPEYSAIRETWPEPEYSTIRET
ncbi:CMRF35-like molecule 8 isoform X2 [Myotis myotis]|uniref:CMRF35-like molecule 8 isoform X2 n=1 Tax=Myotis myotis TaxID=51298 RepID=UPI00174D1624|nr:CMRF35-like molecule 8 isoform X2 [Myotis myotis]